MTTILASNMNTTNQFIEPRIINKYQISSQILILRRNKFYMFQLFMLH
jgi:hypothetical protein